MENKHIGLLLLTIFSLGAGNMLFAQDVPVAKDAESEWQYLEWRESDPDSVLNYEVLLEQRNEVSKEYEEINKFTTEGNETQIQAHTKDGGLLKPGNYRYKVITYNLIGAPEAESDWMEFTVYQAYQPEVSNARISQNLTSTMYLDENNDGVIDVSGKNLFTNAEDKNDISFTNYALVDEKQKKNAPLLVPVVVEHEENNKKVKLQFDMKLLDVGVYHLVATDASGLKSEESESTCITIKFKKPFDLDVCAGYTVPVALYDDTFQTYLDTATFPLSGTFRISAIPFKHRFGYLGVGVSATYTRINASFDTYTIDGNMMMAHLDFVYQLPIVKNRLVVEAHGGVGATMIQDLSYHFSHDINSDPLNSLNLSVNAGGAVQLYVFKRLYVDVCVDYVQAFMTDMALGMIVPTVSVGWQF